ncbi:MAG: NAD(+)--dinitrogen-reductase ADP-D-ribosyltransferase [Gammaproteobacteria bacterium]|nr:MAG: NAD(+)--dinitrogen-reductase ADP-D-ribosyltransferase [Gammaproteobacteria bacterium]
MSTSMSGLKLPVHTHLSLNRCNVPPHILGSLVFQRHPTALFLDGVLEFHRDLFSTLDGIATATDRAAVFMEFMRASFFLDHPEEAGSNPATQRIHREKADYLRLIRGWLFNADSREGAVLKGWVESRFGLLPRNHCGPLGDFTGANYQAYLAARTQGLYNCNALEAQVDLLYTFCQYELARRYPASTTHLTLYRGINHITEHEILARPGRNQWCLAMNNLNSFTANADRADEFGDVVLFGQVPLVKILLMPDLLPGALGNEQEYLVIGGVYQLEERSRCVRSSRP